MGHYIRKPTIVDAEQWTDPNAPPRGVLYSSIIGHYVQTMQGRQVPVRVGEWIVLDGDGQSYYPIADCMFRDIYEDVR